MQTDLIYETTSLLPGGYVSRAGQLADYTLLFDLVNAYARRLNGRDDLNDPELIRLDWLNEGFNPETDVQTVFAPDGTLVGLAECWTTSQPPVHSWVWVCVHPDQMGLGIWEYHLGFDFRIFNPPGPAIQWLTS